MCEGSIIETDSPKSVGFDSVFSEVFEVWFPVSCVSSVSVDEYYWFISEWFWFSSDLTRVSEFIVPRYLSTHHYSGLTQG